MWLRALFFGLLTAVTPDGRDNVLDEEARGPLAVKTRFLEEVRACGVTPSWEPDLRMETSSAIITYRWQPRTVFISRWNDLPESFKGLIGQWARATAPDETPQMFFQNSFQDIGVAHELGHWLQHQAGRHQTLSRWDGEVEANRIGIAFAELRDGHDVTMRRSERFRWLLTLPYEVPQGREIEDNFNTDYEALARDPLAYGWYQGAIIREALETRTEGDFCDLVRLNAPSA